MLALEEVTIKPQADLFLCARFVQPVSCVCRRCGLSFSRPRSTIDDERLERDPRRRYWAAGALRAPRALRAAGDLPLCSGRGRGNEGRISRPPISGWTSATNEQCAGKSSQSLLSCIHRAGRGRKHRGCPQGGQGCGFVCSSSNGGCLG